MAREKNWGSGGLKFERTWKGGGMTWLEADEFFKARNPKGKRKKLGNNTYLEQLDPAVIPGPWVYGIKLHGTYVVRIYPGDIYELDSGGWHTSTTKSRINAYSPVSVWSKRGTWMVTVKKFSPSIIVRKFGEVSIPFYDGIRVTADGTLVAD